MIDIIPINVASIKIIRTELNASIQKASHHFEAFVADRSAIEQLNESRACMADIVGILKMLAAPGGQQLAESMLNLLDKCIEKPSSIQDFALSALSQAFVGIPCYIEFIVERETAIPALVLPFINEIRTALRQPILFESQQASYSINLPLHLPAVDKPAAADLASLIPRQRQMYQLGLIGLIREENLELKMKLMHRAMSRLADAVGPADIRTQWRLSEAVLESLLSGALDLTFTRKRTLALLDAELRKFEQAPETTAVTLSPELMTELVYLVHIGESNHAAAGEIRAALGLQKLTFNDRHLQHERAIMQGPNAETISTMVLALREELAQSKEVLEIAAQDVSGSADLSSLVDLFHRVGDILSVVGLSTPSQTLDDMYQKVKAWVEGGGYSRDDLLSIADGLLYVESSLANLSRMDLNFRTANSDEITKRELMAKSQLNEAEAIVIKEAQAGIAMAKKDINSFIESGYDMLHISNVVENLTAIRGGLQALRLNRAAAVLASCSRFIQSTIDNGIDQSQADSILATMADALIALEYYLSEYEIHGNVPASVLAVAEESLAALGYPVGQ